MAFSLDRYDLRAPSWFYTFRWLAILGMGATIVIARSVYGLDIQYYIVYGLIGFLVLWNFSSPWLENFFQESEQKIAFIQILVDLFVLTSILWFSGGLVNPFASFYVLHVLMAGILLTPMMTGVVALITVASILALFTANPLVVGGESIALRSTEYWLAIPISLILLVLLAAGFILLYLHRLKQAQEESAHREKMAAVGRLVAGMAHEMGTPLNVILLLAKDLFDSSNEEHKEDLQTIMNQAKRCGDLVSLLLGYSHPSGGSTASIKSVSLEVEPWLNTVFKEAKGSIEGATANLHLMTQLTDTRYLLPELVLRQVVVNLIRNSLQAACDKADALISINVSEDAELGQLRVLVKDNGPGFSKHQRDRAFEAFFTTKEPGQGEGLGLYISYYLVEQIGGYLSIPRDLQGDGGVVELRVPYQIERKLQ